MTPSDIDAPPCKVTTMGGGSGQDIVLSGLRDLNGLAITAVVSMVDSGGSSGRLRNDLGILPPGDILKCALALSPYHDTARQLLNRRFFKDPCLKGHNAGNMLLTMLAGYTGSFTSGVSALAEILEVRGAIHPVTTDRATLVAELIDGTRIFGEEAIDIPCGPSRAKIGDVFLAPHHGDKIQVFPPVIEAIENSDYIILGPGDLYTSIIPNLIVPGVAEAISRSRAKLLYVVNIMTKYGETHDFKIVDFVENLERFTRRPIDEMICNTARPKQALIERYAKQNSEFVEVDPEDDIWTTRKLWRADLLASGEGMIRHDPEKLARLLKCIFDGAAP